MVAGGGASVVYADTISDYGFGKVGLSLRRVDTWQNMFPASTVLLDSWAQNNPATHHSTVGLNPSGAGELWRVLWCAV